MCLLQNMDRTWMYERFNPSKTQLRNEFIRGVNEFVEAAKNSRYYLSEGVIRYPCVKCRNMKLFDHAYVKTHLGRAPKNLGYTTI